MNHKDSLSMIADSKQIVRFRNGVYAIYGIPHHKGKVSAWFNAAGNLLNAVGYDWSNRSFLIVKGSSTWRFIAEYGPLWESQDRRNANVSSQHKQINIENAFKIKVDSYVAGLQKKINDHYAVHRKNMTPSSIQIEDGNRYVKILCVDSVKQVYAFIDKTGGEVKGLPSKIGDIYKPANFRGPTKHARGNIYDPNNGLKNMGVHDVAYLK